MAALSTAWLRVAALQEEIFGDRGGSYSTTAAVIGLSGGQIGAGNLVEAALAPVKRVAFAAAAPSPVLATAPAPALQTSAPPSPATLSPVSLSPASSSPALTAVPISSPFSARTDVFTSASVRCVCSICTASGGCGSGISSNCCCFAAASRRSSGSGASSPFSVGGRAQLVPSPIQNCAANSRRPQSLTAARFLQRLPHALDFSSPLQAISLDAIAGGLGNGGCGSGGNMPSLPSFADAVAAAERAGIALPADLITSIAKDDTSQNESCAESAAASSAAAASAVVEDGDEVASDGGGSSGNEEDDDDSGDDERVSGAIADSDLSAQVNFSRLGNSVGGGSGGYCRLRPAAIVAVAWTPVDACHAVQLPSPRRSPPVSGVAPAPPLGLSSVPMPNLTPTASDTDSTPFVPVGGAKAKLKRAAASTLQKGAGGGAGCLRARLAVPLDDDSASASIASDGSACGRDASPARTERPRLRHGRRHAGQACKDNSSGSWKPGSLAPPAVAAAAAAGVAVAVATASAQAAPASPTMRAAPPPVAGGVWGRASPSSAPPSPLTLGTGTAQRPRSGSTLITTTASLGSLPQHPSPLSPALSRLVPMPPPCVTDKSSTLLPNDDDLLLAPAPLPAPPAVLAPRSLLSVAPSGVAEPPIFSLLGLAVPATAGSGDSLLSLRSQGLFFLPSVAAGPTSADAAIDALFGPAVI